MQKQSLIFLGFLLILCILTTLDGLTQYPLTDLQMRKTARLKLEYINLFENYTTLSQAKEWCDSIRKANIIVLQKKDLQLTLKERQVEDLNKIILLKDTKFDVAVDQSKKIRQQRNIFIGTTILGGLLLLLVGT